MGGVPVSIALSFCLFTVAAHSAPLVAAKDKKATPAFGSTDAAAKSTGATPAKSVYDFSLPAADGTAVPFAKFKGRPVLVVNLARQSSYEDQLPALVKLSQDFAGKGLIVIGVPSNDFGGEEPGTDAEVAKFYEEKKLGFPVMARSSLRGITELPLFAYLTAGKDVPPGGDVHWNFTKFLIDAKGNVVARFSPDVAPDSPELRATMQQVLDGTYTAPKKPEPPSAGEGTDDSDGDGDNT